ncbi:MAG: hypothetical protein LBU74_02845 [Methanobacteriaceae archaeon]|jgi:Fe2+ transport system protein B|nr:hypothetical protein [Candidatus Methanorudis spinitermitis]
MYCQNHPNKESVATCVVCGKSICDECRLNIAGNNYCQECVTEIVATEAPKKIKPQETSKNNSTNDIEEKYEKYLDDIYYEENNITNNKDNNEKISLKEQLARDEAKHGSIIRKPRKPTEPTPDEKILQNNVDRSKLRSEKVNDKSKGNRQSLHPHIHSRQKKKKEEESTTTEIILTIILIFMIILVVSYLIYLFTLAHAYPNFFDAIFALFNNPAEIINNIFS